MRREATVFEEAVSWVCCLLLAAMALGIAGVLVVAMLTGFKLFGVWAALVIAVVAALTYGIRRYLW